MKMNCALVKVCTPAEWEGHYLPNACIKVRATMTCKETRDSLYHEIWNGFIYGGCDDARLMSADLVGDNEVKRANALIRAACAAVRRDVRPKKMGGRFPFVKDDGMIAYFVFVEVRNEKK